MMINRKIICIILSFMVAVTFMPATGLTAFAAESDPEVITQPEPAFNPGKGVSGLRVNSFNYKSVTIGWSEYEYAAGYQIYYATSKKGKYRHLATTADLQCYDKKNNKLGKYRYYKVRAYGMVEGRTVYTGFSGILSAKPNLPGPANVKTAGSSSKITVSWGKVYGASKYQVYRSTSINGKYKKLTTTKKSSYTGKSVTKNKKYYYKIRAKRGSKNGYYSGIAEGITILTAPSSVGVSNNKDGGINVSWSGVGNAAGYEVFRSTSYNSNFQRIAFAGGTSYTDSDTGLVSGTTYFYKVRAYARVNGGRQVGYLTSGSYREGAVAQAESWIGCRESNGSHKGIIKIYNSATKKWKIGYGTSWCAAFVSAVGVKTGNTSIIPVDCYCPRMLNKYKSWNRTRDKNFAPSGGDIVFFDWNNNKIPDHVGMVYSRSKDQITTIEGNYNDSVMCRTYSQGWSNVLSYGIPAYNERGKITYNYSINTTSFGNAKMLVADPVKDGEVQSAVQTVEADGGLQVQPLEASIDEEEPSIDNESVTETTQPTNTPDSVPMDAPKNDLEKVDAVMEYIEEEKPAEKSPADETLYNAFLMFNACEDMGIDACVVTEIAKDGEPTSYNEIIIDGERYIVDPSEEGSTPVKYIPEEIN